jgi:hypothetical protein
MGQALDRFSKALAEGTSRRTAFAGLLASAAAALPWTAEAKKKRHRRRRRRKERDQNRKKRQQQSPFVQLQEFCDRWCRQKFGFLGSEFDSCVALAEDGQGPCYSSVDQGPGYFCSQVLECIEECCPDNSIGGGPVTDGECCPEGETCEVVESPIINGIVYSYMCVVPL